MALQLLQGSLFHNRKNSQLLKLMLRARFDKVSKSYKDESLRLSISLFLTLSLISLKCIEPRLQSDFLSGHFRMRLVLIHLEVRL